MKKLFGMALFFYIIFLSQNTFASHHLRLFDFNASDPGQNEKRCSCATVKKMIKKSINYSIDSQIELQNLYQARAAIRVSLGQILPQFDPSSAIAAGIDLSASIDTFLPLIGALFPNRWFDFKATYIMRKAEKYMIYTVLANKAQLIQDIYYNVQMQMWSIKILDFYINEIEDLIEYLKTYRGEGAHKVALKDLALLENMKAKLSYDRSYIDALSATLPQLATEVGLNPSVDWSELRVEPCSLGSLKGEKETKFCDYWSRGEQESPEIKYAQQAIRAARATKFSSYIDFMDIGAQNTINFGTFSKYKTARSQVDVCRLQLKQAKMNLSNGIQNALNNYNDAVVAIPQLEDAMLKLEDIRSEVLNNINNNDLDINISDILWYFKYAKGQALRLVVGYFSYKAAQADLDRYTWDGPVYAIVKNYIETKLPGRLKEIRRSNSLRCNLAKRLHIRHKLNESPAEKIIEPNIDEEESD